MASSDGLSAPPSPTLTLYDTAVTATITSPRLYSCRESYLHSPHSDNLAGHGKK